MQSPGNNVAQSKPLTGLGALLPALIDIAVIVSFIWLLPLVASLLSAGHAGGIVLIIGAYFAMCGGLWLTKLIHPPLKQAKEETTTEAKSKDECSVQGCALAMALPFGIFVLVMIISSGGTSADVNAGLDALTALGEAQPLLYALFALLFVLIAGAFVAALLAKPKPRLAPGTGAALGVQALGVLGIDAMVLVTAAFWEAELADAEPMGLALGGRILVFAASYVFFLMFYAPPRLALLSVEPGKYSLYTFLAMLAVVVWRLTA